MIAGSLEYVTVPLTSDHDLTGVPVYVATSPAGPWDVEAEHVDGGVRVLAGTEDTDADLVLAPGRNRIYLQVSDDPEVPILYAGSVPVTTR